MLDSCMIVAEFYIMEFFQASVPNWLREEIIKKKAVITSSSQEHPREETQFIEEEGVDKSFGKGDQADSKSIDSSRSTEEEDDDEVTFFCLMIIHFDFIHLCSFLPSAEMSFLWCSSQWVC